MNMLHGLGCGRACNWQVEEQELQRVDVTPEQLVKLVQRFFVWLVMDSGCLKCGLEHST